MLEDVLFLPVIEALSIERPQKGNLRNIFGQMVKQILSKKNLISEITIDTSTATAVLRGADIFAVIEITLEK
jgi:hypothetical protein